MVVVFSLNKKINNTTSLSLFSYKTIFSSQTNFSGDDRHDNEYLEAVDNRFAVQLGL